MLQFTGIRKPFYDYVVLIKFNNDCVEDYMIQQITDQFKISERPIRDTKNGTVLTGVYRQLNTWAEHFGELINRPRPKNQSDIQQYEKDVLINCNKPTREEIKQATGHIQHEKEQALMVFQQKH